MLRLDPDLPLLWRTPTSLQIGLHDPVVLDDVGADVEGVLAVLIPGCSLSGVRMIARGRRMTPDSLDRLLERLAPALLSAPAVPPRTSVRGRGALAQEVARQVSVHGMRSRGSERPDLVVAVVDHVMTPDVHGHWLRRDLPHLPVTVGDELIEVGPLVVPGAGPCVYCSQLARRDADPSWPALATQLQDRAPASPDPTAVSEAAGLILRRVRRPAATVAGDGLVQRLVVADGSVIEQRVEIHPDCRCAAPSETDWAPATGRAGLPAPSAAAVVRERA